MTKSYAPPKIRQIVTEAVFRRQRLFVTTVFVVVGLVALVTLLMPKRYAAEAKLMVQNVRTSTPLTTNSGERLISPNDVSPTEVNSEVDLLQSPGTVRKALGASASGPENLGEEKQVTDLQHRLTVEAVHQTNLINLKLLGRSPEEASTQLQRVIDSYFEVRAGSARSSGAAEFFDRQAQDEARQLRATQQALTDFEVQHKISNLDDEKKLQVTRIAALQAELADADTAIAKQRNKQGAEKAYLATIPERSQTMNRTITNQYSQERLGTSLVDLQNRRSELVRLYPPTDRQVIEIDEKIATTQRAIAAAAEHPANEASSDVNPVWQQLRGQLATSSGELSGMMAQRASLAGELSAAQQRLKDLDEATGANDELRRKLSQTQADYALYAQKRDEARISQELDREKMFDVSLVQAPIASLRPTRPRPLLYMASGLTFALLLGTFLALYADTSAEQVHTPLQLDALTGSRTLAVLADESDANQELTNTQLEFRRVLGGVRTALLNRGDEMRALGNGHDAAVAQEGGRAAGYCVAFTSALAGEGTSYLVNNLALIAAKQGLSRIAVLDVEALLHKFEAEEDVSFAMRYDTAKRFWKLALDAGPALSAPMHHGGTQGQFSARLNLLLIEGRKEFDLLFLDCPSFRESTLASELDVCVDGYVAVVGAGMARRQNIEQMEMVLKESRAPLLGYVLNRRRYPVPQWLHRVIW
jgi:uncharacterized protein involved in exopolysaccharide biosynthesis/Mrp family chromosome partitioning ATPase